MADDDRVVANEIVLNDDASDLLVLLAVKVLAALRKRPSNAVGVSAGDGAMLAGSA